MIRLFSTTRLPSLRSISLFILNTYSKKDGMNSRNKMFKQAKTEKEQPKTSKLNLPKQNKKYYSKPQQITPPSNTEDYAYRRPNKFSWSLPSLIPPQFKGPIQASLASKNKASLEEEWKKANGHKDYLQRTFAVFDLVGIIIPKVVELQIPVPQQLLRAIMEGYFCSHIIAYYPPDHLNDTTILDFLTKNKQGVENYFATAKLKPQLRFYTYLKDLSVRRAGYQGFRSLLNSYFFIYKMIQSNLQKMDFAQEAGRDVMQLFSRTIRDHPLNSEDERLLNCICSQVPFFPPASLLHFLQTHPLFLQKADPTTLLSVLEAAKLQGFQDIRESQFQLFISIFASLERRHPEVADKVEELLCLLFERLLRGKTPKYQKNFIMELLVELSKQVQLKPDTAGVHELFAYFKSLIQALSIAPQENLQREANMLFEVLTILLSNKFIRRSTFAFQLQGLEAALERAGGRRKELQDSYLWGLLKAKEEKLQVFNAGYLLQLSVRKQVDYIKEVVKLDDVDFAKSLMLLLVNSQGESPLLALKRMLPQYDYQQILTKINACFVRHGATSFYKEIFWEVVSREDFSGIAIDLIDNLHRLQEEGGLVEEEILRVLLQGCFRKTYKKIGGFKRTLGSLIFVLQFYINTLKKTKLLLAQPYFYYIMSNMLSYLKISNEVTQFKINIYRMLAFVLDSESLLLHDYIQFSLMNFSLEHEDFQRLKIHINLFALDRSLTRFKLDHLILAEEVPKIYDKVVRGAVKVTQMQRARINKLFDFKWQPDQLTQDTLVAYFMDSNVLTLLKDQMETVDKIIQQATMNQIAYYVYNFAPKEKNLKSNLFTNIWQTFLNRLKVEEIPRFLCTYILGKYQILDDDMYVPFLQKVLQFYTLNPNYSSRLLHKSLLIHIRNRFQHFKQLPPLAHAYVMRFKQYFREDFRYLNNLHRFNLLHLILQLGYPLEWEDFVENKSKILQNQFAFFFIILHEDLLPTKIQTLLTNYLQKRIKRKLSDFTLVDTYIDLKYPKLKKITEGVEGCMMPTVLKDLIDKQLGILKRLNRHYPSLQLKKKLHCIANDKHLIAFCPNYNKPFRYFLEKFYKIEPSTSNLQVNIYDFDEIDKSLQFFDKIQAEGIVSGEIAEVEPQQQKKEESPQERLAKAVARLTQQQHESQSQDQSIGRRQK